MPMCEKCWSDAHDTVGNVAENYCRMMKRMGVEGHRCTPEQQAGPDATVCPTCGIRSVHQCCHVCVVCGWSAETPTDDEERTENGNRT